MATQSLDTSTPAAGVKVMLDTSALLAFTSLRASAAGQPVESSEVKRGQRIRAFIKRSVDEGALIRTTVLAMEELAAKVRGKSRVLAAQAAGVSTWKDYKRSNPQAAATADLASHAKMLQMMAWAADELGSSGVRWERPRVDATNVTAAADDLRRAHRQLLRLYPSLDAMDALHIVVGAEMGITSFVTLDNGWSVVPTITVFI